MKEIRLLLETEKDELDTLGELLKDVNAFCIISIKDMRGNIEFEQEGEVLEYYYNYY